MTWLEGSLCVLFIDEINKLELNNGSGRVFSTFLQDNFLSYKGRYFVFTSHVLTTGGSLTQYMDQHIARNVKDITLPVIDDLQLASTTLQIDLKVGDCIYFGNSPALNFTQSRYGRRGGCMTIEVLSFRISPGIQRRQDNSWSP